MIENLQKYSHGNKKALEQFISFIEKNETLNREKVELEEGPDAIRKLTDRIDLRKDEDIL